MFKKKTKICLKRQIGVIFDSDLYRYFSLPFLLFFMTVLINKTPIREITANMTHIDMVNSADDILVPELRLSETTCDEISVVSAKTVVTVREKSVRTTRIIENIFFIS